MKVVSLKRNMPVDPLWTNQDLVLYHGTLHKHVKSILRGIDIALCDDATDFGLGFYTTTNVNQATQYATNKALYEGGRAALIEFTVSRDSLAKLDSLWFVRSAKDADDYWNLVTACRKLGVSNRGGNHWYDIVVGPVARRFQKRFAWGQYDQISFHTHKAAHLLDNKVTMVSDWT